MLDDIETWMDRRKAQAGQFARDAEAAGRQAWNDATRSGQDVLARTQSELAALGAQQIRQTQGEVGASSGSARPPTGSGPNQISSTKILAYSAAQIAGNVAGLGQGVGHSLEGLGQGALFATRLLDPDDAEMNGAGKSAWGQVFNTGKGLLDYVKKGITEPASVADDIKKAGQKLSVETVPSATPMAPTFAGEMARNFDLGSNQGQLDWDIGSLLFGAAAAPKLLRGLGAMVKTGGEAKFLAQGFNPTQADYLAAPYKGMGHHFVPRNALKPIQLPRILSDSPFNVLDPTGMSRGDFYQLHYEVDPNFHGTGLGAKGGGGGWSGKILGLQKYGPWGRLWQGSPAPLNTAVGAVGTAGLANFQPSGGEADDRQEVR